jgi:nitrous oxidase accessory protein
MGILLVTVCIGLSGSAAASAKESAGRTLQNLIDKARSGDTLMIQSGVYSGNLVLDKHLTLLGDSNPVIQGDGTGSVITIIADSCTVRGFVVQHCGSMLVDEDAGILVKSSHNIIESNKLRDILFGIYLLHANNNRVAENSIIGGRQLALGDKGSGIHIWNSQRNAFLGNTISDVRDGLYIQNANHTWIENNESFNVRYGLHYMYADSNTFLNNSFHDNVAGAAIMYSRGIVMRNNIFAHNRGFASFGILFQDCHGLLADSNVVMDNVVGMFFEASTDNKFKHNVVAQNDVALEMFQNSTNNVFTENNFVDNLGPLTIVGKRTDSRWSLNGRGNYWSSYDGYDLDGDGIGDVPMKIQNAFQFLEGRNANIRLYLYSPATQALAIALKAFPIMNINEETDDHPLVRPFDVHAFIAVTGISGLNGHSTEGASFTRQVSYCIPFIGLLLLALLRYHYAQRRR